MTARLHIPYIIALTAALGCGDSTGETGGTTGSTGGTTEATGTTTSPVDTGQTQTTQADSTGSTAATSLDTSEGSTTAAGTGEIEVSIEGMSLASGDTFAFAAPVDVGATSDAVTVTIENVGDAALTISGASLTDGSAHFALDDAALDGSLAPGASTSFMVTFAPTNGGDKQALVQIDSDDADEGTYTLALAAGTTPNVWRDLAPGTSPPARFNAAMAATDDGRVLLFGGRLATGMRVADTWIFDVEAGDWTELAPPSAPSARDASAMASIGNGAMVLFGGTETSGPGSSVTPLADTWVFDLAAETWTELEPETSPPVRFQHAMASVGDGTALLYGGRPEFGQELADTWRFDGETQTWTDLAPPMGPGPRSAFALASDGAGTLVLVGGSLDSTTFTDETWVYDASGNTWTMGAVAGLGAQFNNAAAWVDGETFVAFSGKPGAFDNPVPGTWAYDAAGDAWTDLAPTEPAPRFSHRLVSVGGNKVIMFGGLLLNANFGSATAETWEYVGP